MGRVPAWDGGLPVSPENRLHLRTRAGERGSPDPGSELGEHQGAPELQGSWEGRPLAGGLDRTWRAAAQTDLAPRRNLSLVKELGDRAAQGRACGNLGNTHYLLGSFAEATAFHKEVGRQRGGEGRPAQPPFTRARRGHPGAPPSHADVGPATLGGEAELLRDHRAAGSASTAPGHRQGVWGQGGRAQGLQQPGERPRLPGAL